MAYDEDLANRIRELIAGQPGVTEKKMFGGLAFLIGGNMAVAASGQGGVLVRVDPASGDALVARRRPGHGDARQGRWPGGSASTPSDVKHEAATHEVGRLGTAYARSLPAKKKKK